MYCRIFRLPYSSCIRYYDAYLFLSPLKRPSFLYPPAEGGKSLHIRRMIERGELCHFVPVKSAYLISSDSHILEEKVTKFLQVVYGGERIEKVAESLLRFCNAVVVIVFPDDSDSVREREEWISR